MSKDCLVKDPEKDPFCGQSWTEGLIKSKYLHDTAPKSSTNTVNCRKNERKQGPYPDVEGIDSCGLRQPIITCLRPMSLGCATSTRERKSSATFLPVNEAAGLQIYVMQNSQHQHLLLPQPLSRGTVSGKSLCSNHKVPASRAGTEWGSNLLLATNSKLLPLPTAK